MESPRSAVNPIIGGKIRPASPRCPAPGSGPSGVCAAGCGATHAPGLAGAGCRRDRAYPRRWRRSAARIRRKMPLSDASTPVMPDQVGLAMPVAPHRAWPADPGVAGAGPDASRRDASDPGANGRGAGSRAPAGSSPAQHRLPGSRRYAASRSCPANAGKNRSGDRPENPAPATAIGS